MAAVQEVQNGEATEKVPTPVVFTALKPQLLVEAPKASEAVQFYKSAFGAVENGRTMHSKRKAEQELPLILSAQLEIGGSTMLISDSVDDSTAPVKSVTGGCVLYLETEDVEAAIVKAVNAGAVKEGEIIEGEGACFSGLVGKVKDPYGFTWLICSPVKKCTDVEG